MIALAVAMVGQPAVLAQSTTAPATTSSSAIDWNRRIQDALTETGNVENVATELAAATASPDIQRAQVRVAMEQGDLKTALAILKQSAVANPADAATLEQLSRMQELVGQNEAARSTLMAAVAATTTPAAKSRLLLRLAMLAFDAGQSREAIALLDQTVAADPTATAQAGVIAYLYGQFPAATAYFKARPSNDPAARLLEGNAALKSGDTGNATKAFDAALTNASRPFDRTYAIERLIATARQAKTLPALADAWLAEKKLPAERLLPLATVLRELDRGPDLLKWWQANADDSKFAAVMLSDRFVNEVLGAAQSAGRGEDAVRICQNLLARQPDSWQWLTATLRAQLSLGHGDEADALLRERLNALADSPDLIHRLGRLARGLGRDATAIEAADRMTRFGGSTAVAGRLLAASVYSRSADRVNADQALRDATQLARQHPIAVNDVVSALESAGQDRQAIDLLQASLKVSPDDAKLGRLASLLLKTKQFREAIPVLEKIISSAASPAIRMQAAQRLREAAAASQSTDELIQRLQARIKDGQGTEQDLSLLVDALLSHKKFDAAVETLKNTTLLNEAAKLRQLSVLYLRNDKLDQADAALRELAKADPTTARETLERLASVAIARKKPDEATAAIKTLQQQAGPGPQSIEMMAGVLDRLGRTAEAAAEYRKLLAAAPENADDWLLWSTAMSKTGQGTAARRRLLVLCGEASTDNVFAIAVDGLLNLNAPPEALRVARRDAILRLAERPAKMMLNHVLADVSEELADPNAVVRATEISIAVSDEERAQRLRQLMDVASQNGLVDTAVDCGRSLLALGDDFPPQLFMQLGEQLLIASRPAEASRAFARAAEISDPDFVATHAAKLLEQYAYPTAALEILRPLADRRQTDHEFRQHLAGLNEVAGRSSDAFDQYLKITDLSSRANDDAKPKDDALEDSVTGALLSARSPQQRDSVLALLESRIRERIDGAGKNSQIPDGLARLATAFRHASLFCDQPNRSDQVDQSILARWPDAKAFNTEAVQDRMRSGRYAAAYEFATKHNVTLPPALARYAASLNPAPTTLPSTMTVKAAAEVLPLLMVRGDYDQARAILANVKIDAETTSHENIAPGLLSPFRTLVMAANALGDEKTATQFALTWANTFEKPKPATRPAAATGLPQRVSSYSPLPAYYLALVTSSWRGLPDAARAGLIAQMRERLEGIDQLQARGSLSLFVLQLSAAIGQQPAGAAALGAAAVAGQTYNVADNVGRALSAMPVAERPAFLSMMCEAVPANRRLSALTAVLARANDPLDEATANRLIQLASKVPAGQLVDWSDWFINDRQPALLRALAEAMQRLAAETAPGSIAQSANLTAVAAALASAGDTERADQIAAEALASMAQYAPPSADPKQRPMIMRVVAQLPDRPAMLRVAVAALSPKGKSAALAKLQSAGPAWTQADQSWRLASEAVLLEVTGDRVGALNALRTGLSRDPNEPLLISLYRDRLVDDGRQAELAELAPRLAGTGWVANVLRRDITQALRSLFRWREVPVATEQAQPTLDFLTPAAAHDTVQLATAMRGVLQRLRESGGPGSLSTATDAGGLSSQTAKRDGTPPAVLDDFTEWPGTLDDVLATLHCNRVNGSSADWLAALVTRVAKNNATVRGRLMASLQKAINADTVSMGERIAIANLARSPDVELQPAMMDALWLPAVAEPAGPDLRRVAEVLVARSGSTAAAKWLELDGMSGPRMSADASDRPAPTPLDTMDDSSLATWLRGLADRDPAESARQYEAMRSGGRITPRAILSRMVGARLAAERGDVADFADRLNRILHDWANQEAIGRPFAMPGGTAGGDFDLSFSLPTHVDDPQQRTAIATALQTSLSTATSRWPGVTDFSRAWASAGQWLAKSDQQQARLFLQKAIDLGHRQGLGEHQLWAADLAMSLGQADAAMRIETALLGDRCLPAPRIAPLLQRLRDAGDQATADRLAADASIYCADPRLQKTVFTTAQTPTN